MTVLCPNCGKTSHTAGRRRHNNSHSNRIIERATTKARIQTREENAEARMIRRKVTNVGELDIVRNIEDRRKVEEFDTRTHWHRENILMYPLGNHDTVKELGSLVQQAQLRACVMSNRGSGNCAESRTQSFTGEVEKFFRDGPSTILHLDGTLSNHGQEPSTGICA